MSLACPMFDRGILVVCQMCVRGILLVCQMFDYGVLVVCLWRVLGQISPLLPGLNCFRNGIIVSCQASGACVVAWSTLWIGCGARLVSFLYEWCR